MNTILIVDDHDAIRQGIRLILELKGKDQGFQILEASNGIQALKLIEQAVPHLAIVDLMMPEMDGYELCKQLAAQNINLPVIILTAKADAQSEAKLKSIYTPKAFITKPVDNNQLYETVNAVLEGKEV